jgi:hypothetical protein
VYIPQAPGDPAGRPVCGGQVLSFWANQFRVSMTAAADVLMQELRLRAARTRCARAQVRMLLERLLKLGAHVLKAVGMTRLDPPRPPKGRKRSCSDQLPEPPACSQ